MPDFEAQTNLRELVDWTCTHLCGPDKEFGGLVVIFDEFLTFVHGYGHSSAGSPLQSLAQGFADHPDRSLLITFSQIDPRLHIEASSSSGKDLLLKEIDRIDTRVLMHSVVELVVDSYLHQNEELWMKDFDEHGANSLTAQVDLASERTFDLMSQRYVNTLDWIFKDFAERVGVGCFPLHPATTALFSSIHWEQDISARSTLQFVLEGAESRKDAPALVDGRPNWVMPADLVDYFTKMIGAEDWRQLQAAIRQSGPQSTPLQQDILRVILLIDVAHINTKRFGFVEAIALLTASDPQTVQQELGQLEARRAIKREHDGTYRFREISGAHSDIEELVNKHRELLEPLTQVDFDATLRNVRLLDTKLAPIEPSGDFTMGHLTDWAAPQELKLRPAVSRPEQLIQMAAELQHSVRGGDRGLIYWLVPRDGEDVVWFRTTFPDIVREAFGTTRVPITFMLPKATVPTFMGPVEELRSLGRISPKERSGIGAEVFTEFADQVSSQVLDGVDAVLSNAEPLLPAGFDGVDARRLTSPSQLLTTLYSRTYSEGPSQFVNTTRANRVGTAVGPIADVLSSGDVQQLFAYPGPAEFTRSPGKNVIDFLKRWHVVDQATRKVAAPPANSPVAPGWNLLENSVKPGSSDIALGQLITRLLNAPYGYDVNVATLVVVGWLSHYKRDITLRKGSTPQSIKDLIANSKKVGERGTPVDILRALSSCTLSRRQPTNASQVLREIQTTLRSGEMSFREAQEAVIALEDLQSDEGTEPAESQLAEELLKQIKVDVERTRAFVALVNQSRQQIKANGTSIEQFEQQRRKIERSEEPTYIKVDKLPTRSKMLEELDRAIERAGERLIQRYSRLTSSDEFAVFVERLDHLDSGPLRTYPALRRRILAVKSELEAQNNALIEKRKLEGLDAEVRVLLQSIPRSSGSPLPQLQNYRSQLLDARPGSAEMQEQVKRYLAQVDREILEITNTVRDLVMRSEEAASSKDLQATLMGLRVIHPRLGDTPLVRDVDMATERIRTVLQVLEQVEHYRSGPKHSASDYKDAINAIKAIATDSGYLTEAQATEVNAIAVRLENELVHREKEAIAWLDALERSSKSSGFSPSEGLQRLERPQPYLPATYHSRLDALRSHLLELRDQNHADQIRHLFQQIGSQAERDQLLQELQSLVGV